MPSPTGINNNKKFKSKQKFLWLCLDSSDFEANQIDIIKLINRSLKFQINWNKQTYNQFVIGQMIS